MSEGNIGKGLCLGIGGTNARVAVCENGTISDFRVDSTPTQPADFFAWMAEEVVHGVEQGAKWAVIGVPGVVTVDTQHLIGPLYNVPGLSDRVHNLENELAAASPKMKELLAAGFPITAVNDGLLAAFASADKYSDNDSQKHQAVAYFIMGTGVGGAIVRRQKNGIFRPSEGLFEFGHVPLQHDLEETFETALSGTGLHRKHGAKAEHLDADHEAWQEVGQYLGQMVMMLGLIGGADLVVMGGGTGSNAYAHYFPYLERYLERFRNSPNLVQRRSVPKVIAVDPKDTQTFEMYGAEGVMANYLSSK